MYSTYSTDNLINKTNQKLDHIGQNNTEERYNVYLEQTVHGHLVLFNRFGYSSNSNEDEP